MRTSRFLVAFWLAGAVVSMGTVTAQHVLRSQHSSLPSRAEFVTPFETGDRYEWKDDRIVGVRSYQTRTEYDVERRSHKRTHVKYWEGAFTGVTSVPRKYLKWLPAGAKVIGFASVTGQEAWTACWMPAVSVPMRSPYGLTERGERNARFGIWITQGDGSHPRLLVSAPLSEQEFRTLQNPNWQNTQWVPGTAEISFVYRGGLYVIPISDSKI